MQAAANKKNLAIRKFIIILKSTNSDQYTSVEILTFPNDRNILLPSH